MYIAVLNAASHTFMGVWPLDCASHTLARVLRLATLQRRLAVLMATLVAVPSRPGSSKHCSTAGGLVVCTTTAALLWRCGASVQHSVRQPPSLCGASLLPPAWRIKGRCSSPGKWAPLSRAFSEMFLSGLEHAGADQTQYSGVGPSAPAADAPSNTRLAGAKTPKTPPPPASLALRRFHGAPSHRLLQPLIIKGPQDGPAWP